MPSTQSVICRQARWNLLKIEEGCSPWPDRHLWAASAALTRMIDYEMFEGQVAQCTNVVPMLPEVVI